MICRVYTPKKGSDPIFDQKWGLTPFLVLLITLAATPVFAQADERTVYAGVVDRDGATVLDLTAKDFVVREDGMAREVLRVAKDDDPLQIALLVDNSAEMRPRLTQLRRAASAFVKATREGVPIALITLAERPTIVVGYTTDRAQLQAAIDKMFSFEAGNYLLDGIAETSQALAKRTMSRASIAVITGLGPEMSYRQYTEVLRFFREGGASLHVLQLGMGVGEQGREIVVSRGTSETGGRFEEVFTAAALELKAQQLATEISNQYRITYARPPRLIPPKKIDVSVRRPNLRVRSRPLQTEKER
jgi:VWFA-related protein